MSRKVIQVNLTEASINNALKELNQFKKWIETKTNELLEELAKTGVEIANVKFRTAIYDGTNDVECRLEVIDSKTVAVIAVSKDNRKTELFIEFGTGIRYSDFHPESSNNGMIRGEFGDKKGANPKGWTYYGEAGSNGKEVKDRPGVVRTYGNPANMSMYYTIRELEKEFIAIAKKVFQS